MQNVKRAKQPELVPPSQEQTNVMVRIPAELVLRGAAGPPE